MVIGNFINGKFFSVFCIVGFIVMVLSSMKSGGTYGKLTSLSQMTYQLMPVLLADKDNQNTQIMAEEDTRKFLSRETPDRQLTPRSDTPRSDTPSSDTSTSSAITRLTITGSTTTYAITARQNISADVLTDSTVITSVSNSNFSLAENSSHKYHNMSKLKAIAKNPLQASATKMLERRPEEAYGLSKKVVEMKLRKGESIVKLFPCPKTIGVNFLCQYYRPGWKGREDIQNVLEERMARVREVCGKYHQYMFNTSLSKHGFKENPNKEKPVLFSKTTELGFCWMPKMGSTFWQKAWKPLERAVDRSVHPLKPAPQSTTGLRKLFIPKNVTVNKYENFTRYTVSRDPWQRIVSVYREKCEGKRRGCTLDFGYKCDKTFKDFVRCFIGISSKERTEYHGHLDTTYRRCHLCEFPYNYVMSMENMKKESEFIFTQAGVINPLNIMDNVRNKSMRKVEKEGLHISYTDYWRNISNEMIDKVRFYYKYEIFLFDYPETPFHIEPIR